MADLQSPAAESQWRGVRARGVGVVVRTAATASPARAPAPNPDSELDLKFRSRWNNGSIRVRRSTERRGASDAKDDGWDACTRGHGHRVGLRQQQALRELAAPAGAGQPDRLRQRPARLRFP